MDLFKGEYRLQVKKIVTQVTDRVAAKARLWDFLGDTKEIIVQWEYSEEELAMQLITSVISILYPAFSAVEMERELRNIYYTLKRPVPTNFVSLYCDQFCLHIAAKLKRAK